MDSLHMANLRRAGDRLAEFHHTAMSEACRRAGFRIAELEAELASARAELDAARADAERYRWLRNDALAYLVSGPICVAADKWGTPIKTHPESDPSLGPALPVTLDGKELDAAIDAARKERT
jgi:hypothetical protein